MERKTQTSKLKDLLPAASSEFTLTRTSLNLKQNPATDRFARGGILPDTVTARVLVENRFQNSPPEDVPVVVESLARTVVQVDLLHPDESETGRDQ